MRKMFFVLAVTSAMCAAFWYTPISRAQTENELKDQIADHSQKIRELEQEIASLQGELDSTNKQKQTLQSAVASLDLTIKKLTKSISLTEAQIAEKDKEIKTLSGNITTTSGKIGTSEEQVAQTMRSLNESDTKPIAMRFLAGNTLSSFFDELVTISAVRIALERHIVELNTLKTDLETSKSAAEKKRRDLANLKQNLTQQKQGLTIAKASQTQLLQDTKNKESNYQALIAQKKTEQIAFENQMRALEAQLNLKVNPGSFAAAGAGVLSWPVAAPYITQYFGNTSFATANPQIYGNRGHNAIDLRASDGTPILAAREGVVEATGNTDLQKGCYSYGKWILIRHDNGLSTLYAHLSLPVVSTGQSVARGQLVGYSGRTGYATGPHLHFGVFASAGVKVSTFSTSKNCKLVTVPLVDPTAYLNPLSYLPTL